MNTWRKVLIGVGLGAYIFGFGTLVGVAIEAMRYDRQRTDVLGRYEQALREWKTYRMALEKSAASER